MILNGINIEEVLNSPEYQFLKTNKYLGNNIALLAFGGSIAYGTNTPQSDIDIRGFAVNPLSELVGIEKDFEQVVESKVTDTTIYSLRKIVQLLIKCNPNTIEILGCRPEHYLYINDIGREILNNKSNFISKLAIDSFGGYARSQYNRLEHGLLGNGNNEDKKLQMLENSLNRSIESFNIQHSNLNMSLNIRRVTDEELLSIYPNINIEDSISNNHLLVSGSLKDVPVTDFKTIISEIHKIQSEYGNINKRNTKKDGDKLANHMTHLIRLFLMGTDLNNSGSIVTYREKEHDMLMDIKTGKYMTNNGKNVIPEFYDLLEDIQNKYQESLKNTVLPDKPNYEALKKMMHKIYKIVLN
jgi:hypothetical protein